MMPTKSMGTDTFTEFVNCKNNIGIARKLAKLENNIGIARKLAKLEVNR
jgi:hypothetical protein